MGHGIKLRAAIQALVAEGINRTNTAMYPPATPEEMAHVEKLCPALLSLYAECNGFEVQWSDDHENPTPDEEHFELYFKLFPAAELEGQPLADFFPNKAGTAVAFATDLDGYCFMAQGDSGPFVFYAGSDDQPWPQTFSLDTFVSGTIEHAFAFEWPRHQDGLSDGISAMVVRHQSRAKSAAAGTQVGSSLKSLRQLAKELSVLPGVFLECGFRAAPPSTEANRVAELCPELGDLYEECDGFYVCWTKDPEIAKNRLNSSGLIFYRASDIDGFLPSSELDMCFPRNPDCIRIARQSDEEELFLAKSGTGFEVISSSGSDTGICAGHSISEMISKTVEYCAVVGWARIDEPAYRHAKERYNEVSKALASARS